MHLIDAQNSPRPAVIYEINPALSAEHGQHLLDCVDGTRQFACSVISGPGRSLYTPVNENGLPSLKIKGAGGLKRKSRSKLVFYSPQPDVSYSGRISHMKLNPDLSFSIATSRPKAENSLRLEGARMEFVAQTRLKIHDIGFDGVCYGGFLGEQGAEEIDLNGYRTGFAISEYDLSYTPLSRVLGYGTDANGLIGARKHQDALDGDGLDMHFDLVRRMGTVKNKMAVCAELARHSSTLANFLYSVSDDNLIATDTDTLADYREMKEDARGSQFLRDGVSDVMKRCSELQFSSYSDKIVAITEQAIFNFLKGLFSDAIKEQIISTAIKELNIPQFAQALDPKYMKSGPSSPNISGWVCFGGMYPEIYKTFYKLLLQSELTDIFPIQTIDPEILYQRARTFFLENRCL